MLKHYHYVLLFIYFFLMQNNLAIAQTPPNCEKGSILIKFRIHKNNNFLFSNSMNIKIEDFKNPNLKNILNKSGFKKAEKLVPEFLPKDTLFLNESGKSIRLLDLSKWYKISISDDQDLSKIITELKNIQELEIIIPNYAFNLDVAPNDPSYNSGSQWSLANNTNTINALEAWNYTTGRSDVRIGVIDCGIDYGNSDMDPGNRSRVVTGYDWQDNDSDPRDVSDHGTQVASIIGALTNNNTNIAGIMWNCQLVPLRVGVGTTIYMDKATQALNWCINNSVDIINMSFSGIDLPNILNPFREATFNAYAAGKVLIVSSGNNDSNEIVYPANYPWTIAVGATNESGQRVSKNLGYSWGSNYGDHISIVAPGVNCPTNAHSQSTPKIFNGTSCSTPHVSGAAGLILSKSKDLGLNITNDEIRHLMENSARRYDAIRRDKYLGYGILNAGGALKILQSNPYSVIGNASSFSSTKIESDKQWIISSNTYIVDVYKVTKNIDVSQYPDAKGWIRERSSILGASMGNPNNGYSWADSYINGNTFTIETYLYYIKRDSWNNPVNQWWPTTVNNIQAEYRLLYKTLNINVPGEYSTIPAALAAVVSGQTINVSGDQSITNNITIPNGVTLRFLSGSTLNFNNFGIFGGPIVLENGANINGVYFGGGFYHLQTAINNASSGQTVTLLGRTYSTSINFSGKNNLTITGQGKSQSYINGEITVYSSSGLNLSNFACSKLTLNSSNSSNLNFNIIGSGYNAGLNIYRSTGGAFLGEVNNSYCGVYAYASTNDFYCSSTSNPVRIDNHDIGVNAQNGSNITIYNNIGIPAIDICGSGSYDLYADASTINATRCSFSRSPVTYAINGGYANAISPYTTCLSKVTNIAGKGSNSGNSVNTREDPSFEDFAKANDLYWDLSKRIKEDYSEKGQVDKSKYSMDYLNVINSFKDFMNKNPNSPLLKTALTTIVDCYRNLNDQEAMKGYLKSLNNSKITGYAKRFMIDCLRNQKEYDKAILLADEIITEGKTDTSLITDALYAKGLMLSHELSEPEKSLECFMKIVKNYKSSPMVMFAENELNLLGYKVEKDEKEEAVLIDKSQLSTSNNPNPFNPSTTIRYNLPKEGKVAIRIYDILGRQVAELVNEYKQAGNYSVLWNGKDGFGSEVSSGVYFYNIRYNDQSMTKKMMLIR